MATIVLVHGIDNQREGADLIESTWVPALAGGVRLAGDAGLADRIRDRSVDVRVAYYGHLFRSPDLREAPSRADDLVGPLAAEWLGRVAGRGPGVDAERALRALEIARNPAQARTQGIGHVQGVLIRTLARSSWLGSLGMAFAERFAAKALAQVSLYLTDQGIRMAARKLVFEHVGPETRAIVGHSLGSVVAYECAHAMISPLPLLATLGSPLGIRTIVADRLVPPPSFPPNLDRWLNVANREDPVAAEPDLRPLFARDHPGFDGIAIDERKDPHRAETYLGREAVGRALIRALGWAGEESKSF